MSNLDPRIGVIGGSGEIVVRPTQTLSGKPAKRPYAAMTKLDAAHFVVQDSAVHTPRGFDVQAAIDELKAQLAPASSRRSTREVNSADKPQSTSE